MAGSKLNGSIQHYQLNPNPNSLEAFTRAGYFKTKRTLTVLYRQCLTISLKCKASYKEQFEKIYKTTQNNVLFEKCFNC
jgi:hypothetical protein